jgi:hypothetical protein
MLKRTMALTAATALVTGTGTMLAAAPAHADGPEKHAYGSVGGGRYAISAEKEHRYFEVDAELDGVAAGSTWRMVVRHAGKRVGSHTARAHRDDGRYEVDFREFNLRNTAGKDTFRVTLRRVNGSAQVTRTVLFAR